MVGILLFYSQGSILCGVEQRAASILPYPNFLSSSPKTFLISIQECLPSWGKVNLDIVLQVVSQVSCPNPMSFPFPLEDWVFESQNPEFDSFLPMYSVCHPFPEALNEDLLTKEGRRRNTIENKGKNNIDSIPKLE